MEGKLAIEYFAALVFSSTKLILQYLSSSKPLVSLLVVSVKDQSFSYCISSVSFFHVCKGIRNTRCFLLSLYYYVLTEMAKACGVRVSLFLLA